MSLMVLQFTRLCCFIITLVTFIFYTFMFTFLEQVLVLYKHWSQLQTSHNETVNDQEDLLWMFVERHRVQTNMTPLCLNSLCVFILPFNLALCPQSSQVYITPSCLDSLCSLAKTLVFAMCPHSLQEYKDNRTQVNSFPQ